MINLPVNIYLIFYEILLFCLQKVIVFLVICLQNILQNMPSIFILICIKIGLINWLAIFIIFESHILIMHRDIFILFAKYIALDKIG